jgi:lanosterol synthase
VDPAPQPIAPNDVADARMAYRRACESLVGRHRPDGAWEGEMAWNTTALSQYVIVRQVVGRPVDEENRRGIVRHFDRTRTPDGGWGLHAQAAPSLYPTILAYLTLRMLGLPPDEPMVERARRWIRSQPGGALAVPDQGQLWLALLGLQPYRKVAPVMFFAVLQEGRWPPGPA